MSRTQILSGGALAALLVAAAPAYAQEGTRIPDPIELPGTTTPAPSPAPSTASPSPTPSPSQSSGGLVAIPPGGGGDQSGTIGPDSLRDFSLGGTDSTPRPTSAPTPAPTPSAPQRSLPTPVPPPSALGEAAPAPAVRPRPTGRVGTITPVAPPEAPPGNLSVDLEPTVNLTAPTAPDGLTQPAGGTHSWPWLIALLAMIGAGGYVLLRRRQSRLALAGGQPAPSQPLPDPPQRAPAPEPTAPASVAPPPAPPAGTITSSLKPDLVIEVEPRRAVYDADGFTLEYGLVIANKGRGAARNISLREDFLFASATQQSDYDDFLVRPTDGNDRTLIAVLAPQAVLRIDAKAHLSIDKTKVVMVDGRALLLPILALAVRHGGQAPAQKPAAHGQWLIGRKGGSGGRMAPIRADQGPRVIRDVELRRQ